MRPLKLTILLVLIGSIIGCDQKPEVSSASGKDSESAAEPERMASEQDVADAVDELSTKPKNRVAPEPNGVPENTPPSTAPSPQERLEEVSFVSQKLAPYSAEVERPKDWLYHENHRGPSYTWIISKEDTKGGTRRYETGVQIQAFFGINEHTKKSPEDFVADFLDTRREMEGVTTIQISEEQTVGPFKLITLATDEGGNRIVHTCYWGDGEQFDVAVVVIRGSEKELWSTYRPVFDKLSAFDLRLLVGGARKGSEPK
jgi:hypothetical protein